MGVLFMKIVVVKCPKIFRGLLKKFFKIKDVPEDGVWWDGENFKLREKNVF